MPGEIESAATARHNFRMGVLNGLFITLAETFIDPTLVLVAFVGHLTASPFWLGLVVPLRDASWFLPQLWVSGYLPTRARKLTLYNEMSYVRVAALIALVAAAWLLRDPRWLLVALFAALLVYSLASGVGGLPFLEVVGKTVPPRERGLFFAWRLTLGGLAGIGASLLVRWLLDERAPLAFPHNFGLLFVGWLVFMILGAYVFARVREEPDRPAPQTIALSTQLRRALKIFRADGNLRHFLLVRTALMAAGAATPFFAVYVQRELGGPPSMVGVYLATSTTASLLANMFFGRFSTRLGNRRTLIAATAVAAVVSASALALFLAARPLGLSGWTASLWLIPLFALWGVREAGIGVSGQSLLLDIAPRQARSIYLGFANSWLGLALLATGLGGLVVEFLGYQALAGLAFTASLLALNSALRLREAPHAALTETETLRHLGEAHPAP